MADKFCPVCSELMEFMVVSHRNHPFVDGNCYPAICFSCYQVPKVYCHEFDKKGNIISSTGPHYSYLHLHDAQELLEMGSADNLSQAERSVEGVLKACKKASLRALKKLKGKKPAPVYEFNGLPTIKKEAKKKRSGR